MEAHRRQARGIPFSGVVYAHPLEATIGECVRDLELIAQAAGPEEVANQVLFLPL